MAVGEHRSFDVIAERRERYSNLAEPESTSPIFMLKFLREVSSNSNANTNVDYRYPLSLPKIFKDVLCNHFDRPLTIFILYQPRKNLTLWLIIFKLNLDKPMVYSRLKLFTIP